VHYRLILPHQGAEREGGEFLYLIQVEVGIDVFIHVCARCQPIVHGQEGGVVTACGKTRSVGAL